MRQAAPIYISLFMGRLNLIMRGWLGEERKKIDCKFMPGPCNCNPVKTNPLLVGIHIGVRQEHNSHVKFSKHHFGNSGPF